MIGVVSLAILILVFELRKLFQNFQTPIEHQEDEKKKIVKYIDQMREYLGVKNFKQITILSSFINNGIYVIYYLLSMFLIGYEPYQVVTGFLLIDRIFRFSDTFDLDFDRVDYIVGNDFVLGLRSVIVVLHITVTLAIQLVSFNNM